MVYFSQKIRALLVGITLIAPTSSVLGTQEQGGPILNCDANRESYNRLSELLQKVSNNKTNQDAIKRTQALIRGSEADSLKAQLAFLGLKATIKSAVVNDETWHRVQLGPFASETKLSRTKNLLIENKIKYMQRSLPN